MKSLILIAHGSRRERSNEEIRDLTESLRAEARDRFDSVSCAFLELAQPSIPDAIELETGKGARKIVLVPYFLSEGDHVAHDIPSLIDSKRRHHPNVELVLTPHLGAAPGMRDLLLSLVGIEPKK